MARSLFGGRIGDSVVSLFALGRRQVLTLPIDANGDPTSISLQVWSGPEDDGGVRYLDLIAADGTTATSVVVVPSTGQVPAFYGPDGVNVDVWVRDPDGDFFRMDVRADAAAGAAAAAQAAAEAAAVDAEAAKDAAEAVGNTNDTIMAGVAANPASAFAAGLSATIATEVPAASSTTPGRVELATSAETTTGTDTARATTPAGIKAVADLLVTRKGGQEYHTVTPELGKVGWFPNTGAAAPVIAAEDYILWQPFAKNSAAFPRVWAGNPVAVKAVKSPTATNPLVIGWEISVTNDTDEASDPNPTGSNGAVLGLYISYINTVNNGSAAMYVTGIAAGTNIGWKHGLFLDGIATGGTGISVRNAVGSNAMNVGLDLSTHTGNFGIAAILLKSGHRISGKKTDGVVRELIYVNGANVMVVGDANTQDLPMQLFASEYRFSGISTATAATAGARTLPAAPANFMPVTVAGTAYKIPLYNV